MILPDSPLPPNRPRRFVPARAHAPVCSYPAQAPPCGRGRTATRRLSRKATVPGAGGFFFPKPKGLGITPTNAGPAVLERIAYAGVVSRSFAEAGDLLSRLADLPVGAKQAERVAR